MILKIDFAIWHVLQGKLFEAVRPVLGMFFDVYNLHGVLDASSCRMPHCQWRDRSSFWLDCNQISRWPMAGPSVKSP